MNHEQAKSIIEECFSNKYLKIKELLNRDLLVPESVLGDPFDVSVYINQLRIFEVGLRLFNDDLGVSRENIVFDTSNSAYAGYIKCYGSACYEPEF